jgi:hypothetical protein
VLVQEHTYTYYYSTIYILLYNTSTIGVTSTSLVLVSISLYKDYKYSNYVREEDKARRAGYKLDSKSVLFLKRRVTIVAYSRVYPLQKKTRVKLVLLLRLYLIKVMLESRTLLLIVSRELKKDRRIVSYAYKALVSYIFSNAVAYTLY